MCTPRKAIVFSARLHLDKQLANAQRNDVVNGILDNLGLQYIAYVIIGGGPLMAGGGRIKWRREKVCPMRSGTCDQDVLRKIADAGANVIVTIDQPPPPIVGKINNLSLLVGGRILYDGPMGLLAEERICW